MQLVTQVLLRMFVNFEDSGLVGCCVKGLTLLFLLFLLSSSPPPPPPYSGSVASKGFVNCVGTSAISVGSN